MSSKPAAIAITESLFVQGEELFFSLPGYEFISQSRQISRGGGVGLYIDLTLDYLVRSDLTRMTDYIELIVVKVIQKGQPNLQLASAYRAPSTYINVFNTIFDHLLDIMLIKNKIIILGADLKINLLKMDNHAPTCDFFNILMARFV